MMKLADYSNDELLNELESRGFLVEREDVVDDEAAYAVMEKNRERWLWARRVLPKWRHDTKKDRCRAFVDRISRNRFLSVNEYNELVTKAACKWSGNPTNTESALRIDARHMDVYLVAFYKGNWLRGPWVSDLDEAEAECRAERRGYTKLTDWQARKDRAKYVRMRRDEKVLKENKVLLSQFKELIKDGKLNQDGGAVA